MTIEQKAAAYDEAIKRVENMKTGKCETTFVFTEGLFEYIFPELAESEDEKIRKTLIEYFKVYPKDYYCELKTSHILAWLEKQGESDETKAKTILINKGYPIDANGTFPTYEEMYDIIKEGLEKQCEQKPIIEMKSAEESLGIDSETYNIIVDECIYGEQKPADKVEPKFKVGDCLTDGTNIRKIIAVGTGLYVMEREDGTEVSLSVNYVERNYHLWTIEDAKDGNVLNSMRVQATIIFKGFANDGKHILAYCALQKGIFIKQEMLWDRDFEPCSKNWNNKLFQKMHEAGYTFDFKKKELKKLKFRVGDEIITENEESLTITRIDEEGYWSNDLFICDFDSECVWDLVPAEWSEEDKRKIDRIYSILMQAADSHAFSTTCRLIGDKECVDLQDFLKHLKDRVGCKANCTTMWKPSKEQMEAIKDAIEFLGCTKKVREDLKSLYEQLKKLKE